MSDDANRLLSMLKAVEYTPGRQVNYLRDFDPPWTRERAELAIGELLEAGLVEPSE